MNSSSLLEERINACVPVTGQAFAKLLSLLSVQATTEVPTACVTTGVQSRLLINPDYVATHCRSDDHLAMLVLHELYHVLLGHTRLYRRVTPAQNWAFDCLINAQLCRLFPHPRHTSFFGRIAADATGPAMLLGPPEGWLPSESDGGRALLQGRGVSSRYGEGARALRLHDAHWRLYAEESVTTEELYELLERIQVSDTELTGMPLLGDHGSDGDDEAANAPPLHPEVLREVRDIVARWPMVTERSGRDQGGVLHERRVSKAERNRQAVRVLRQALAWAAGGNGAGARWRVGATTPAALLPFDTGRDRRATVQRQLGVEPLLWSGETNSTGRTPADRVRVYLDVSGSMESVSAPLYAAIAGCLDLVERCVYGFSTEIAAITHTQLRAGLRMTTGGTEIGTVVEHLLGSDAGRGRKARRALVVTDGMVGSIDDAQRRELERTSTRIAAVITDGGTPCFARSIGAAVFRLPAL